MKLQNDQNCLPNYLVPAPQQNEILPKKEETKQKPQRRSRNDRPGWKKGVFPFVVNIPLRKEPRKTTMTYRNTSVFPPFPIQRRPQTNHLLFSQSARFLSNRMWKKSKNNTCVVATTAVCPKPTSRMRRKKNNAFKRLVSFIKKAFLFRELLGQR